MCKARRGEPRRRSLLLRVRYALAVRLGRHFVRSLGLAMRGCRVLKAGRVIALAVMFGRHAMCLRGRLVMRGGLRVSCLCHEIFLRWAGRPFAERIAPRNDQNSFLNPDKLDGLPFKTNVTAKY